MMTSYKSEDSTPGSALDHLASEVQEVGQELLEGQRLWCAIHKGHIVDREARLQLCVLVQIVQHHLHMSRPL